MPTSLPKLIILAGGSSSRLWPLDDKSLLKFMDKTLLEQQLETYLGLGFNDVAVLCNPENEASIQNILSDYTDHAHVRTFVQEVPHGMGDALLQLTPLLATKPGPLPVYICQVHDIFEKALHRDMLTAYHAAPQTTWLASYKVSDYFPGGYLEVDSDLNIRNIIEKPPEGQEPSDLVNIVAHLHPDLGRLLEHIRREYARDVPTDDHYERAMAQMMAQQPFKAIPYTGAWHPLKYSWHVLNVMDYYLGQLEAAIAAGKFGLGSDDVHVEAGAYVGDNVQLERDVVIRQGADIRGHVHLADNVLVEDGVYISGPAYIGADVRLLHGADIRGPAYIGAKSLIGQYANVRQSMVSHHSIIGASSEVNRSYVGAGTNMHAAMVLDSILADSDPDAPPTNISARVVTANLRSDRGIVKSTVKGQRLSTGRDKFGAVIGAGSFIAVNVMLMPGVKIGKGCFVGPTTVVIEDVPDHTHAYAKQPQIRRTHQE